MNLATQLVRTAAEHADRPAVRLDELVLTYADLLARASAVARWLTDHGLEPGDRVALVLPNVTAFPVHFFGVQLAGGVIVPMNPLLKAREIEYYLTDSGARFLFTFEEMGAEAKAACDTVGATCVVVPVGGTDLAPASYDMVPRDLEDTAVILYTSGTTGKPKGAELTHDNIARNASVTARTLIEVGPEDVVMGCLPLFHVFGLTCGLNAAVAAGACLTPVPRFDGAKALQVIERDQVTVFEGVPTMYSAMLASSDGTQSVESLRTCISGGAPLPVEVLRAFEETLGCAILEGYGLSESSPVACFNHPHRERRAGTIGVPVEDVSLRLVDDDLLDVGDGEVGEILIKGPNVMKGYWGLPDATAETVVDGWLQNRRPRHPRRRRLLHHRGPQEEPDHPRGLQRLPAGDRRGRLRAPGRGRGRCGRYPPPGPRRGGCRRGRTEARRHRDARGDPRVREVAGGRLQVSARGLDPFEPAQGADGQDPSPRGQAARIGPCMGALESRERKSNAAAGRQPHE
ncbi:AMP-binding protein [Nocardioides sp. B-3]|uniref:AMP-binding protein n=1 Tax=Nocardioides sp. B-3 TaxID=2895565 RepID=UPI003FA5DB2A